jgi:hypothetical protein
MAGPTMNVYGIKCKCEEPCQVKLIEPKLVQLDMVSYKWFTAMCSKWKPMTGPIIIKKAVFLWWNVTSEHSVRGAGLKEFYCIQQKYAKENKWPENG